MSVLATPTAYRESMRSSGWHGAARHEERHGGTEAFVDFRQSRPEGSPAGHATWPADHRAWEYSKEALSSVERDYETAGLSPASGTARRAMLTTLRSILAPDSVYPTFSIDEDGSLMAEWRFEPMSLELYAETDGATHFVLRQSGKAIVRSTSTTPLRRLLRDVSSAAARRNPNWRSLFVWPTQ